MRLQLTAPASRAAWVASALVWFALAALDQTTARADDEAEATTTWFQEPRVDGKSLTVIHPQVRVGADLGETFSLGLGYSADIVSGATPAVFSVDAVSSATPFDDVRHSGSLNMGLRGRRASLSVHGELGVERDYLSFSAGASATVDLPGKNTQLSMSYSHAFDQVCDKENATANGAFERRPLTIEECGKKNGLFGEDNPVINGVAVDTVWRDLAIDSAQGALTQNLSPTLVGQLSVYGSVLRGFQSNPYRRVRVRQFEAQETLPDVRGRLAIAARINKYLIGPRAAVSASLRGYFDTWGVNAGTIEMAYQQYLGGALLFRFRGRLYQQTAATFFKDAFFYETEGSAGAFFTGDRELAPIRNIMTGAKLSYISAGDQGRAVWGVFDEIRLNLKADVLFYQEFEAESNAANPMGIARQYATSPGLIDGLVLQLGLALYY